MTETATLPGLETVDPPVPQGEPRRWIERGPQKRLMLFSGSSNRDLAERIAETLGVELGEVRSRRARGRRRRPRRGDGPARGPDPGFLQRPRRPHDRAAALCAVLPGQGPARRGDRRRLTRPGPREDGAPVWTDA